MLKFMVFVVALTFMASSQLTAIYGHYPLAAMMFICGVGAFVVMADQ